jgi:O-antigen/teichoic acid export membrane protein
LFAGKLGTAILSFLILILLARVLTVEQMGKYSLFLMIVSLALTVGLNWSDASIIRHGREEYVKEKKINKSFWARMYIFLPVIFFFILLFIIFRKQITNYISIEPKLIVLLIVMFIFNALINFIISIYQSINQMKKSAYVLFFQKAFYLICLALIFFNVFKANLALVLLLTNISFLLAIITNIVMLDFRKIMPYEFNKAYFKKIWSYSWPQLIGFPGLYLVNYIDLFVIKRYMTLKDVGIYNVAYSAFINIAAFILIIHTVFLPLIVEYRVRNRRDMIEKYVKKIPFFAIIWIALVLIGLALSKYVIPLIFSQKYVDAIPSFNILLIASIFYFVAICVLPLINAFDLILPSQIINLIKAAVNIVIDFILIPKIGIIGGAYGTVVSYFVGMILSLALVLVNKERILRGRRTLVIE